MRALALILVCCGALSLPAVAQIDPIASSAAPAGGPGWLMSCPAGDGQPLLSTGMVAIIVQVIDTSGALVAGLGPRDFEVDGQTPFRVADAFFPGGPGWDVVPGGFNVISPGLYRLDGPLWAGGSEPGVAIVKVQGVQLSGGQVLPLRMVSPDLSGDGVVNLSDIVLFSTAFFGAYDFRADFNGDGIINLADIPPLAAHMGHTLPAGAIADPVD